ncbi:hypothetical protein BH10BAC4_BH10BAC4_22360 [soil metagenome]
MKWRKNEKVDHPIAFLQITKKGVSYSSKQCLIVR